MSYGHDDDAVIERMQSDLEEMIAYFPTEREAFDNVIVELGFIRMRLGSGVLESEVGR